MKNLLVVLVSGLVLSVAGLAADRPLTLKEVSKLTATANTPADHLRLARHFELKAVELETESKEHADMAKNYRANPAASETKRPGASDTAAHCETLSQDLAKAAQDARILAHDHEVMAKQK